MSCVALNCLWLHCTSQALEPAALPLEQLEEQAAEARRRMGASPRQLLEQLSARGGAAAKPAPLRRSVSAASTAADSATSAADTSESGAEAGQSAESASRPEPGAAAAAATAALALAESYHRRLVESADEQRVAQLLPGVDAARLTASSDPAAQRQVVLQLAAAGRPAGRRDAAPAQASPSATSSEPPSPSHSEEAGQPRGRKKSEAAEAAAPRGGLSASRAGGLLAEALSLGERYNVPAWEVQLQYIESLLTHNQAQLEAVHEAVQPVWGQLLGEHAEAALAALAGPVYAAASSGAAGHLCFCLDLMRQCCGQLAAQQPASSVPWGVLAAALQAMCASAASLASAAPGIDAKAFIAPLMAQLAPWVGSSMDQPAAAGTAALREQVAAFADAGNAQALADCLESLAQAHAALAAVQPAGGEASAGDYGLGRTTPSMALLLKQLPALPGEQLYCFIHWRHWLCALHCIQADALCAPIPAVQSRAALGCSGARTSCATWPRPRWRRQPPLQRWAGPTPGACLPLLSCQRQPRRVSSRWPWRCWTAARWRRRARQ